MDEKEYRDLLLTLTEMPSLVADKRDAKKRVAHFSRKIKTVEKNYLFLKEIVALKSHDLPLEYYLKLYFKSLNYDKVEWLPRRGNNEDLRIWKGNQVIISDCSGFKHDQLKSGHILKVNKYVVIGEKRKSMNGYERRGLVIVNHENEKHYSKRVKNPFKVIDDVQFAEKMNIGLVTTTELLYGFIKIKNGEITLEQFHHRITTNGIIEF